MFFFHLIFVFFASLFDISSYRSFMNIIHILSLIDVDFLSHGQEKASESEEEKFQQQKILFNGTFRP